MSPAGKTPKAGGGRWCLYIVKCRDGTLYTGITNDLERRLDRHNSGKASRYTRSRLPVRLLFAEGCKNRSYALKKELRIKALTRREKEAYIRKQREQKFTLPQKRARGAEK